MVVTNYSDARANLASLMDRVVQDREEVRITRQGRPDVVLVAADEWESWKETVYLFRSPANAARLREALDDVAAGRNVTVTTVDRLKHEVGLGVEEE